MRGDILAAENQQDIINDVIEVKRGMHLHGTYNILIYFMETFCCHKAGNFHSPLL